MTMNYTFSAKENKFYKDEYIDIYVKNHSWPNDAVSVEDSIFIEFSGLPPNGKIRCVDESGMPCWRDVPPLSHDEIIANADADRCYRIINARERISLWQTQLQLGMISDADKANLIEWMHYITALQAVDTSTAPDIQWPPEPQP